ncbi:UDP-glycosyltransferase 91B1 [Camellia lanceoleosa]|uniref:UDP-glycosyltransferase 91B1 n=1 Tax=Camellia lanceoleosa TaxID=1840588 RepID=A0ACC0HZM4_9ERIC|nr:UDP-glycosyltransferase 91B1 [Camellia lanceoleosa]
MEAFRLYEVLRMMDGFTGNNFGVSDLHRLAASAKGCDVLVVRSCFEFEPKWLQVLEEIHEKPIFPVGQLPTTAYDEGDDDNNKDA